MRLLLSVFEEPVDAAAHAAFVERIRHAPRMTVSAGRGIADFFSVLHHKYHARSVGVGIQAAIARGARDLLHIAER